MTTAIATHQLSKKYTHTDRLSLNALSIQIKSGEVYGFLGPNGAGKSTTIRTLLNFIQPTSGTASILGKDSVTESVEVKRHIGYLAGEIAVPRAMTGQQFLDYMGALQPVRHLEYARQLMDRFDVELHRPLHTLSKGNRQKVGIIQAFMHEPEVLILDEPTSGLDPLMQEEFFSLVKESKERGAAIFISSHNFAEVQRMCDRVGFIREGKLVIEQNIVELAAKASHTFTLTFADAVPLKELKSLRAIQVTPHDSQHVTLSINGELTELFALLAQHHVTHLQQQDINLEEQFLHLYKKEDA